MPQSRCGSGEKHNPTCLEIFQRWPHCIKKAHLKSRKSCKPLCFITFCKPSVSLRDTDFGHPYSAPESVKAAVARTRSTFPYLGVFGRFFKTGFLQLIFLSFFYHVNYCTRNIIATGAEIVIFTVVFEPHIKMVHRCRANKWHENATPKVWPKN